MIGPNGGKIQSQAGIIPSSASELFRKIQSLRGNNSSTTSHTTTTHTLYLSFIEISNKNCYDLLPFDTSTITKILKPKLTSSSDFTVNAHSIEINTLSQLFDLLSQGSANRKTNPNEHHKDSSRSHAIVTLTYETFEESTRMLRRTKHTFVDLAGSESFSSVSENAGINQGVLALNQCIAALASGNNLHVPFRDSTLTMLLKAQLLKASTTFLACVNPENVGESQNTIRYTKEASRITSRITKSEPVYVPDDDPLGGDVVDSSSLDRRIVSVPTSYGDINARAIGNVDDPLILYVHGSGSGNSSLQFVDIMEDLSERAEASTSTTKDAQNNSLVFTESGQQTKSVSNSNP